MKAIEDWMKKVKLGKVIPKLHLIFKIKKTMVN